MDTDSCVPAFKHDPLPSARFIRVIKLLPSARRDAPIRCTIEPVHLDSTRRKGRAHSYEALSYVWGSPVGTLPILCNGRRLLVTPNCRDALNALRRKSRTRVLWIDAICIDQTEEGTEERNEQVKLMGEVYQRCRRVIIWLGQPQTKDMDRVFYLLSCIARLNRMALMWPWLDPVCQRLKGYLNRPILEPGSTMKNGASAMAALRSKELARWLIDFWADPDYGDEEDENYSDEAVVSAYPIYRAHELEFLASISRHSASLLHDKVYGMYALLAIMGLDLPSPDYARPLEEVFADTTKSWIKKRKTLAIILTATRPGGDPGTYPSWTPAWAENVMPWARLPDETGCCFFTYSLDSTGYRASRDATAHIAPPEAHNEAASLRRLGVRGKCLGLVSRSCSSSTTGGFEVHAYPEYFGAFTNAFREWCDWVAGLGSYPTGESPLVAFYRTVTFHRHTRWNKQDHFRSDFELFFDIMRYPHCQRVDPRSIQANAAPASNVVLGYMKYIRSLDASDPLRRLDVVHQRLALLANYAFFFVDSGHMGIAYHIARPGDEVWLLAGSHCPVILRRHDDEEHKQYYRFVAPAFVDGVMDGEAWPADETLLQDIVLV
ncbi:hypothetical protein ACRALDRAFT_1071486 [Sodiomyces alcalophilus JCM 7366]|uniref:uncharacterized protein n=1 Tax=Sodiomyces alcalophilus JCM 7366 TaxID=591952 RepID=UPI0039B6651C